MALITQKSLLLEKGLRPFDSLNIAWSLAGQQVMLAVATDGTAWISRNGGEWQPVPSLPQSSPADSEALDSTERQWLGGVAIPNGDGWIITQVQPCGEVLTRGMTFEEVSA